MSLLAPESSLLPQQQLEHQHWCRQDNSHVAPPGTRPKSCACIGICYKPSLQSLYFGNKKTEAGKIEADLLSQEEDGEICQTR